MSRGSLPRNERFVICEQARRPLKVAAVVFLLGALASVVLSDAPARVHLVSIPLQFLFLIGGTALASLPISRFLKGFGLLTLTALMTYVGSQSIDDVALKVDGDDPTFLLGLFAALAAELLIFLTLVWFVSRIIPNPRKPF